MEDKLKQEWNETQFTNNIWANKDVVDIEQDNIFEWWLSKFNDYKSTLQQQVEGLKVGHEVHLAQSETDKDQEMGYNQAIEDFIKIISDSK